MAYVSLDSDQIKKANKKHKYTHEQVLQLEKCMDPKTGPSVLHERILSRYSILPRDRWRSIPFPYQERLIESYNNHQFFQYRDVTKADR